jgi:hypothetical protein
MHAHGAETENATHCLLVVRTGNSTFTDGNLARQATLTK